MSDLASLKATLKRGALVAAANWPIIVIQFIAESTFKLLLGVPVVGGVLLVGLALGRDVRSLLDGGFRDMMTSIAGALVDHPGAFASFVASAVIVVLGGSTLMFLVKGGTVTVMVKGADAAGAIERAPLRLSTLQRASAFSIPVFTDASARLFRRYLRLGLVLLGVYAVSGALFLLILVGAYRVTEDLGILGLWTITAALLSAVLMAWISAVNFGYLLVQMIVAAENCSVREASRRAWTFVARETRPVLLVLAVVLALVVFATIASWLATAGLGLVSFVPLVGLAVFPLQAAAWLVRGIVFQYLGLAALGAYYSLYRPAESAHAAMPAAWARTAS